MQMITLFKYKAIPIPTEGEANKAIPSEPGETPDNALTTTPAERFARELTILASQAKAVQILQFPGFILVGEIAGVAAMEQTVMPGSVIGGTDLRGPQGKGNRGH